MRAGGRGLLRQLLAAASLLWLGTLAVVSGQVSSPSQNPVAALQKRLEAGEGALDFAGPGGYLGSVLKTLGVNEDSQLLVFSKTSLDTPYVSPRTPRAIYFNDEVAVALTPGAPEIEFTAVDRRAGLVFYTLDVRQSAAPRLVSRNDCGGCHQGVTTPNVLGLVMMSVFTKPDGGAYDFLPIEYVDQRTPFRYRWGGWYVTGTHGSQRHRGNAFTTDPATALNEDNPVAPDSQNVLSVADRIDGSRYPSATSDIVALMTFEHQAIVTNLMFAATRASRTLESATTPTATATARTVLDKVTQQLADAMLFVDVDALTEPIRGVSTFTSTFQARGLRDGQGRSLREFDLRSRLFRYPVSFMVYSDFFDALPEAVRATVYRRLFDGLTSPTSSRAFSEDDRRAALAILRATKASLPGYWLNEPPLR